MAVYKNKLTMKLLIAILVATAGFFGYKIFKKNDFQTNSIVESSSKQIEESVESSEPKVIKTFTAEEFMSLYNSFVFPNTEEVSGVIEITGNRAADIRIQQLAEARGYRLRTIPKTNLSDYKKHFLQQKALQPWLDMQVAAKAEGLSMEIISAFRPIDEQRDLFLERLSASAADIADGRADSAVNNLLNTTAAPGYSRHHNGYTIDIFCGGQTSQFKNTACFKWLSKNNYANAKKFGWIPSYPEGIEGQGPEPEEWEYVWVGTEALYE